MAKSPVVPVTEITLNHIKNQFDMFLIDAGKLTNKAASTRARKLSLEITKSLKAYRYNSIKA